MFLQRQGSLGRYSHSSHEGPLRACWMLVLEEFWRRGHADQGMERVRPSSAREG